MATNFPTSLDTFTNPTTGSALNSPSHAGQHADINDAMEAVQAKLGTGDHTVGEPVAFTPSWVGLTIGNGTEEWYYCIVNSLLVVQGFTTLGSTSSVTAAIRMTLPASLSAPSGFSDVGQVTARISGSNYACVFRMNGSTEVYLENQITTATYLRKASSSSTTPATWGSGSIIRGSFMVVCS